MSLLNMWVMLHPQGMDFIGFLPQMVDVNDPRPVREQLDGNYRHGGGWQPMRGWYYDKESNVLQYPGDPAMYPVASIKIRDELMLVYEHAWVAIIQPDGAFEVARMD